MTPRAVTESKKSGEAGTHLVQQGETLRKIAGETKHEGVSLEQMLVGLFKKNPDAFIGDNINRLKAGMPSSMFPTRPPWLPCQKAAEAKKFYLEQAGDWNAYRQKLARDSGRRGKQIRTMRLRALPARLRHVIEEKASPAEQAKDQVKVSTRQKRTRRALRVADRPQRLKRT